MAYSFIIFKVFLFILFSKVDTIGFSIQNRVFHRNVVVAKDGSGNFTSVMKAVQSAPDNNLQHFVIYVKAGTYIERVVVSANKRNLVLIGDGMDTTIISYNVGVGNTNMSSYDTATFAVFGNGFIAKNISFRNTAGPRKNQAVALYSNSDRSVFYRCGIFAYQDSLLADDHLQFYRECKISGTVDFIFGHAAAVFQKCNILVRKGLWYQKNAITAQGGQKGEKPFGFSFQFCTITANRDLIPFVNFTQTFLGRPWKPHSRVIFMQSYLSDVLNPKGWLEWNKTENLDTLYYAEYKNYGPGARLTNRVKWPTFHILNASSQAVKFTVAELILGKEWLPLTGVPFTLGFGRG